MAPALEPPPPRRPLGWQEALAAARRCPPAAAIAELDRHPFSFPLDRSTLALLRAAGLAPPVVDYLTKRARVDWGALRGDVDPETPAARPQVSGRAGG